MKKKKQYKYNIVSGTVTSTLGTELCNNFNSSNSIYNMVIALYLPKYIYIIYTYSKPCLPTVQVISSVYLSG